MVVQFPVPEALRAELVARCEKLQTQLTPPELYHYVFHQTAGPTLQVLLVALRGTPATQEKLL